MGTEPENRRTEILPPAPSTQLPISHTPPHLAERIRAVNVTDGERKTITALFADLKGSTALIEGLDPEEARAIIDPALHLMMDAVHQYDGYVAQALGDGIFALFGAPLAHEDHPQRALYAALRMQEAMRRYADTLRAKGYPPLLMRVGINTGEVVLRSIRKDDLHADYVPVGHSTNLAARMEQLATPGTIVVSAYTHRLTEAINHLITALELLKTLPDTLQRTQQELALQVALGLALMSTKGWAAPEVEKTYARARELCQKTGETSQLFPVLVGLWSFYSVRAEHSMGCELAEQILRLSQSVQQPVNHSVAHFILGETLCYLGELIPAREPFEQGIALSAPHQPRRLWMWRVAALSYTSLIQWFLGYPEQALKTTHDALTLAHQLSPPFSLAHALGFAAMLHQLRREVQATQERTEALSTLASEEGFSLWVAWGTIYEGWGLVCQGRGEEMAQMYQGLSAYWATGAELWRPYLLGLLAEAYRKSEQVEEGLRVLTEALATVQSTEERYYEAELYRLKGELTLQQNREQETGNREQKKDAEPRSLTPDPQTEAEACFLKALDVARQQQAKSWELRAVMSLARLWQRQGKKTEAHQMLADLYGWFTEGFDTKDLQAAQALLEELNH